MAPIPQAIRSWEGSRQSGGLGPTLPFVVGDLASLSGKLKHSVYKKVWFSVEHLQAGWGHWMLSQVAPSLTATL